MIKYGITAFVTLALMGSVQSQGARAVLEAKLKALKERKAREKEDTTEDDIEKAHKTQSFINRGLKFDKTNKFQKAEYDSMIAHMNSDDLKSYDFIEGFIERSTDLTNFSDIQKDDVRLSLKDHQKDFRESKEIVLKPLEMSMYLYAQ